MLCPKCKTENPEGLKFCNECGAPFKTLCGSCGFENATAAKFCGQCGAAFGAPAAAASAKKFDQTQIRLTEAAAPENLEGERKTVTALFADKPEAAGCGATSSQTAAVQTSSPQIASTAA